MVAALRMAVFLIGITIPLVLGIVYVTYGSIATDNHWPLVFIVALGYESLALLLSGLVSLVRPAIALVILVVLLLATWVAAPITVGRAAPEITDCKRINSVVEARDYHLSLTDVGSVCSKYVRDRYPLKFG